MAMTETEMVLHIEDCKKDACKVYKCTEKDLVVKVLPGDLVSVRLSNAALKERQK